MTVSHPTVIPAEAGIQGLPGSVGSSPVQAKACPPVRARGRLWRKQGGWLWTPAFAGVTKGLLGDLVVKITPGRIDFFDQFEFPSSSPFFDALLAKDGLGHRRVKLGIDEPVDGVSLAEPLDDICSMFPDTAPQIASDADVKRPVPVVGEDVDARLHAATMMACQL